MKWVLILTALILASCATLNEEECKSGNWYELGRKNGRGGQNLLNSHNKACQEYGITPNQTTYQKGFAEGVVLYCTPENGYREGVAGNTYYNVCPIRMESKFLKKYRIGQKIYNYKNEYNRVQGNIDSLRTELSGLRPEDMRYSSVKNELFMAEGELDSIKKKLIFLRAQSGYDLEDIVDYF